MEKKAAEVIIIGAGIIGTSLAYHLAKLGLQDVIVCERDTIGSGSTEKAGGIIRQQCPTEVGINFSLESIEFFERFEEETGHTADYRKCGNLCLFNAEEDLQASRRNADLQRKLGGDEVHFLSPKEAKGLIPEINIEGLVGASYCPTDGKADPYSLAQGFASGARRLGVKIYEGTEVIGIKVDGGRVRGVLLKDREIESPLVVNAGGPWAKQIGKVVGLDIPVRPYRRNRFFTAPTDKISKNAPLIRYRHDDMTAFSLRREGLGLTFTMLDHNEPESLDATVDWDFLPIMLDIGMRPFPFLGDIGIKRGEGGLREDTPDLHPILGEAREVEGFYLACGLSGRGIMHSPAVGRIMAECITGKGQSPVISLLSLDRFKAGLLLDR